MAQATRSMAERTYGAPDQLAGRPGSMAAANTCVKTIGPIIPPIPRVPDETEDPGDGRRAPDVAAFEVDNELRKDRDHDAECEKVEHHGDQNERERGRVGLDARRRARRRGHGSIFDHGIRLGVCG